MKVASQLFVLFKLKKYKIEGGNVKPKSRVFVKCYTHMNHQARRRLRMRASIVDWPFAGRVR